ncbi:c-type cytochrome domain-containing protein [Algoriphagus namhaensis]
MLKTSTLRSVLENTLFVWIGLSVVLFLGSEALVLPDWIQVIGRSHPLILHFPIVLILFGLLFFWLPKIDEKKDLREIGELALISGVNFAGLTVVAGLILAQEDYEGDALNWHQNAGMIVFLGGVLIYFFRNQSKNLVRASSLALAGGIVLTGHWGADLTHGENFLLAPITDTEPELVALNEAEVFRDVIKPILDTKCVSCHKEGKIKGELRLDHLDGIKTGGKTGPFVVGGDLSQSLMITRINLPLEEKEHMPPKNKAQLTDEEKMLLINWVKSGASFDQKVMEIEPQSELFQLASLKFSAEESFDFPPSDPELIGELNNFFRKVEPLYPESPALVVSYFGIAAFDPGSLNDLNKVREQVVQLNLNKMPLAGVDLGVIPELINLQELQVNFTDLSAAEIETISQSKSLKRLSLSGNKIGSKELGFLAQMSHLEELFLWQSGLSEAQKADLKTTLATTAIDFGFDSKAVVYELNAPKIESDKDMFGDSTAVRIEHPIGSVDIRYTLDGSEPDSLTSMRYEGPLWVKNSAEIKARAFAEEWKGSPVSSIIVFRAGNPPKELRLLTEPNPNYFGKGNVTLIDQIKGKNNHTSGEWLGYQDQNALFEILLHEGQKPKELTISLLYHEGAYIFPPTQVQIWVNQADSWKLVTQDTPKQSSQILPSRFEALTYALPSTDFNRVKVQINRITSLPAWHPGAGAKGWVFIDEVSLLD